MFKHKLFRLSIIVIFLGMGTSLVADGSLLASFISRPIVGKMYVASCNGITIELKRGSITDLEHHYDALVNAANSELSPEPGLCAEFFNKAGSAELSREIYRLKREGKIITPLSWGVAVVTAAHNLHAYHIIHAVAPDFRSSKLAGKINVLRDTYLVIFGLAKVLCLRTIAVPLLSTNAYRGDRSLEELARETMASIVEFAKKTGPKGSVKKIVLVAHTLTEMLVYAKEFERAFGSCVRQ